MALNHATHDSPSTPQCIYRVQDKKPELGSQSIAKLLEAVDEWIPTPMRDLDKPFLLPIEHVYSIAGRGTVVTGRIERGKIQKGQDIEIIGENAKIKTKITGSHFVDTHMSDFTEVILICITTPN